MRAYLSCLLLLASLLGRTGGAAAAPSPAGAVEIHGQAAQSLRCVAFSPYVDGYDPVDGPHPSPQLIDTLLDNLINQAGFRCIMTYGVLNGLDYTFEAAQTRGMKVIAILWLDTDPAVNEASITRGIEKAKQYPDTILRLSCGSEVRVRHGAAVAEPIVRGCVDRLKQADVTQPVTSIDTWWGWCNEARPCQRWGLADDLDWIGINVFPWWENRYSGLFPCTAAADAPAFHVARYQDVANRYPGLDVILTEFGWPAGPDGYRETNERTGQQCGVAGEANQRLVLEGSLARFDQLGLPAVLFEAFREPWKGAAEGAVGPFWGTCAGDRPYGCPFGYGFRHRVTLPLVMRRSP